MSSPLKLDGRHVMSKLLINEKPLQTLPSLAKALKSVDLAIITQQIHYWIDDERAPVREGKRWHYATFDKWLKEFPWLSLSTLKRNMKKLEDLRIVIAKEYGRLRGDRTKWYTLNYERLHEMELPLNTHSVKMTLPSCQNDTTIVSKRHDLYRKENNKENNKDINNNNNVDVFLLECLTDNGVNKKMANELIKSYDKNVIENALEALKENKPKNKAAWLVSAIRNGYKPFKKDSSSPAYEIINSDYLAKQQDDMIKMASLPSAMEANKLAIKQMTNILRLKNV